MGLGLGLGLGPAKSSFFVRWGVDWFLLLSMLPRRYAYDSRSLAYSTWVRGLGTEYREDSRESLWVESRWIRDQSRVSTKCILFIWSGWLLADSVVAGLV